MKFFSPALLLLYWLLPVNLHAQEYNYFHYDIKDGLSGLTVYTAEQDKSGFMWFGTDAGLSRFDGSKFKNFTTNDGLPDNEVLKLLSDSKNRLWILSFSHIISYYQNGVIHNAENDSLLRKIRLSSEPVDIIEDKYGNIVLLENTAFHIIDSNGNVQSYSDINGAGFWAINLGINERGNVIISILSERLSPHGWATAELDGKKLTGRVVNVSGVTRYITRLGVLFKKNMEAYRQLDILRLRNGNNGSEAVFRIPANFNSLSYIDDSLLTINTDDTILLYNINQKSVTDKFFLGKVVNQCLRDSEGNFWFTTNGYGVYRLTSSAIRNYNLVVANAHLSVYALYKKDNDLFAGTNRSLLWRIDRAGNKYPMVNTPDPGGSAVTGITQNRGRLLFGSGFGLFSYDRNTEQQLGLSYSVKSIMLYNDTLLVSTNRHVITLNAVTNAMIDTLWTRRSTCAYRFGDKFFVGALDGLYRINNNKLITFLGKDDPLLSGRISALTGSGDTLWIGTFGNGVMAYRDGKVILHIAEQHGLTSNNCRALYFDKGTLWIATDKGLNGVRLAKGHYSISSFSAKDGLNCDIINCLLVSNDTIYMGTPFGIIYFNPGKINNTSIATLVINAIRSKKATWDPDIRNITLKPQDNSLMLDFSCISFKSQGDVQYRYRIINLDSSWKTTRENVLEFASLPYGAYVLELYATNAFGKRSDAVKIHITVGKPFYSELWFIILVILILIAVTWILVNRRIRLIMKRESEKAALQKRITELEQMALRSQMNPHFIFNCLNSIQQYVFDKNVIDANRFISEFSSLIRQTLNLSSRKVITLEDELKYLETYIRLERIRFENSFEYSIDVDEHLQPEQIDIPPLLLQPYVENSIRHGIRNLKNGKGQILLSFSRKDGYLHCVVQDNGVGRKVADQIKGWRNGDHQSRGLSLVQQRIDALNAVSHSKISIKIDDVYPLEEYTGTRVIIDLPFDADIT